MAFVIEMTLKWLRWLQAHPHGQVPLNAAGAAQEQDQGREQQQMPMQQEGSEVHWGSVNVNPSNMHEAGIQNLLDI